jgi:lipid-binding SYLF domain-containing protein
VAELLRPVWAAIACLLLLSAPLLRADSGPVIDEKVQRAIATFRLETEEGARLMDKAAAVLVFPDVVEMGFGIGGEYGEGSLLIDGESAGYYSTGGSSFGLQVGLQFKALMLLFMTDSSLMKFRRHRKGWDAGVDGKIALATIGADGSIDADAGSKPIIGFVFSNKGLMYNLSLEGSKITPLKR